MSVKRDILSHHLQELSFHEWLNKTQHSVHKGNNIEDVDSVQFTRKTVLQVVEELSQSSEVHSGQMPQGHSLHVE